MAGVRLAVPGDVPAIVEMVGRLVAAVHGPIAPQPEMVAETLRHLIASPTGAVWVSGRGFLAASVQRSVISAQPVAVEHGWYAEDRSGIALLREYERWAQDMGASLVMLSTGPDGPDLARVGYRRTEQAWVK